MNSEKGKITYIFPLVFVFLCILGNRSSSVFLYFAFLSVLAEIIINPIEEAFLFSFFLIPNIRIMDATGITFLVNVLMVAPLVKYVSKRGLKLPYYAVIGTIFFAFIEGGHILAVQNFDNIPSELCWLLAFLLCACVLLDSNIVLNKRRLLFYLLAGVLSSAVSYLVSNPLYAANVIDNVLNGARFIAYADDPNFYSLYLCVVMAIIFSCRSKTKMDYFGLGIVAVIGLLTASKMCLLLMSFIIVATILIQIISKTTENNNHFFMLKVISAISLVVFVFRDYALRFFENFKNRAGLGEGINNIDMRKLTTGRSVIAANYINILLDNPIALFLGYGFQYGKYLGEETNHVAHNTYLDFVLSWGIIGTIVLLVFMIKLLKGYVSKCKGSEIGLIERLPMFVLLINFFDLGCLSASMFWFMWSAVIITLIRDDYKV